LFHLFIFMSILAARRASFFVQRRLFCKIPISEILLDMFQDSWNCEQNLQVILHVTSL